MSYSNYNVNGKIWLFVNNGIQVDVIFDSDQQLTIKMVFENGHQLISSLVYAKCTVVERLSLWEEIYHIGYHMNLLWFVRSDFNVIMDAEEKIEGLPIYRNEVEDFAFYINSCDPMDINFKCSPFT